MFNIELQDIRNRLPTHKTKKYDFRDLYEIDSIGLHHAAISSGNAESYADYHVNTNGWPGIGYAFVILPDGTIQWCWDLTVVSYHVGNSNRQSIGVCFVGNLDTSKPTSMQIESFYKLASELMRIVGRELQIKGHNEYPGYAWKSCPGYQVAMDVIRDNYLKWKEGDTVDQELKLRVERLEKEIFGEVYKPPVVIKEYSKLRFNNHDGKSGTDVHIFKTNKVPELVIGIFSKREYVDDLAASFNAEVAINAGFFDTNSATNEQLGLLVTPNGTGDDVGGWYQSSHKNFLDLVAWKNGKVTIKSVDGKDGKYLVDIQHNAHWGVGTSYALVIDGKKSTMNWNAHNGLTSQFANRSMIGQDKDGLWYLIVADGRTDYDKGLNADEQVDLCLDIGLTWAVNLDGGGSSEMYKDGKIVTSNFKADRLIGSAFIIR